MKYPQIFEVKKLLRRRQEKKTASVQTDGIFDVNGITYTDKKIIYHI